MPMRLHPLLALLLVLGAACGDDDDDDDDGDAQPITCESLAPTLAECDPAQTEADWLDLCAVAELTQDCLQAIASAPCAEHAALMPSYQAGCFPPCNAAESPATCGPNDTLTRCVEDLGTVVYRCGPVCEINGASYTGTCGTEYQGQTSDTGEDVCWCE